MSIIVLRALICAAGCVAATCATAASIKVAVSYTFVEVEVSARQQTHRTNYTVLYTLEGKSFRFHSPIVDYDAELGRTHSATAINGQTYRNVLKVTPHNSLTSVSDYATYTIKTVITTDGVSTCRATRTTILKPGHRYFEEMRISNHDHMFLSDIHFEDVGCQISVE